MPDITQIQQIYSQEPLRFVTITPFLTQFYSIAMAALLCIINVIRLKGSLFHEKTWHFKP